MYRRTFAAIAAAAAATTGVIAKLAIDRRHLQGQACALRLQLDGLSAAYAQVPPVMRAVIEHAPERLAPLSTGTDEIKFDTALGEVTVKSAASSRTYYSKRGLFVFLPAGVPFSSKLADAFTAATRGVLVMDSTSLGTGGLDSAYAVIDAGAGVTAPPELEVIAGLLAELIALHAEEILATMG